MSGPSNHNQQSCACYCANSTTDCMAADYNIRDGTCHPHPLDQNTQGLKPYPKCDRYHYTCHHVGSCRETFKKVDHFVPAQLDDGRLQRGVKSETACRSRCRDQYDCARFVFVTDPQRFGVTADRVCYLFSRDSTFNRGDDTGMSLYMRLKCLDPALDCRPTPPAASVSRTGKPPCWTSTMDVHGSGGTAHKFVKTHTDCQRICLGTATCVAIDWEPKNSDSKTCWILTTTATTKTTKPGVVIHYEMDRACKTSETSLACQSMDLATRQLCQKCNV